MRASHALFTPFVERRERREARRRATRPGRFVHSACFVCMAAIFSACGTSVVSVLPTQSSITPRVGAPRPIEVTVDATTVRLPLVVSGANVAFGDVDRALARSIDQALAAASPKFSLPPGLHLELQVELIDVHGEYSRGRLVIGMAARATLRQRKGNAYVAQTHAHSTASAHVSAARGAPAVLACTDSIARQLSGWLLGLELR